MKPFTPTHTKKCEICGEEFWPESRAQKCCKKQHYRPCPICGNDVPIKYKSNLTKCCSKACTLQLRKQTNLEHWGVDNPAKSKEAEAKKQQTNLERYGATTPFLADDFKEKVKKTSQEKYGTDHPMQSPQIQEIFKESIRKKYGVDSPLQLPEVRQSLYTVFQDPNRMEKIASKRVNSASVVCSDGTKVDSNYEKIFYEFCLRNNIQVERQIPIEYEYNDVKHTTFIDFKIGDVLFECKGYHLLEGCFDHNPNMIPIDVKLDLYKKYHVVLITDQYSRNIILSHKSGGLKYLDRYATPLIGVDIELFNNPKFPYRNDRPECFYHVKVSGNKSAYEAFYDEYIRWKMIVNRILYMGGFIDSTKILTALNVTKTYRQPSWFSIGYAKSLITKYATTDTIVDPFSGWGTRCDAAKQLNKTYIGCDLNKELVTWHNEHGRPEIHYQDAKTFKYENTCTVLVCPPYYDKTTNKYLEDYNYDELHTSEPLTECQWLDILMKNIPKANEYIMVCKHVDDGWEKYITEEKENKSHLGSNKEYVLVVKK